MQAGFISVMGFWVGGYGGFEVVIADNAPIIIARLSIEDVTTISRLKIENSTTIDQLAVGN